MVVVVTLESLVLLLLVVLVAGLLRSHAEILRQLHRLGNDGLDPSTPSSIPVTLGASGSSEPGPHGPADIVGLTPDGDSVLVSVKARPSLPGDTLVAFLSSGCGTCAALWDSLRRGEHRGTELGRVIVVTRDPAEESPAAVAGQGAPDDVVVVMSSDAWDRYGVPGSPYFVLINGSDGSVRGQGTARSWAQLRQLVERASADGDAAGSRRAGRSAAHLDDGEREARADRELMAAGIHPGHPSLYPPVAPGETAGPSEGRP